MLVVPCVYLLGFRSRTYKLDATSKVEEGILDLTLADRSPRAGQLAIALIVRTDLNQFLFGSERASLAVFRPVWIDIQHGLCFYCSKTHAIK
jgi:hypothetical protein